MSHMDLPCIECDATKHRRPRTAGARAAPVLPVPGRRKVAAAQGAQDARRRDPGAPAQHPRAVPRDARAGPVLGDCLLRRHGAGRAADAAVRQHPPRHEL